MAIDTRLKAQTREASGTAAVRRLRTQGWLPAVIYGPRGEPRMIQLKAHDLELMLQHHRSESMMVDLVVNGNDALKVLLKEVQHHPVTERALHADFLEVSMTEKMRVRVPLALKGDCLGVTQDGGVLDHTLRDVEVECLPGDLVESVDVDVTNLRLGQTILVRDLAIPPGLTAVSDGGLAVASVHAQRAEEEVVEGAPVAEAAAAEPELVGGKGKAEEEAPAEKEE
ncbi:MAG: 50S ribosomal protein L25 [Lentisphaerae bacterium]|nr:50S ribosomal protein L25 [Lentisphaerota bacterium]